jgi:hypothetical protein
MALFAVIAPGSSEPLQQAIERDFPKSFFEFAPGQFLVKSEGMTAEQMSQRLGANGEAGKFIAISISGFWGFHDKRVWEWLEANSK